MGTSLLPELMSSGSYALQDSGQPELVEAALNHTSQISKTLLGLQCETQLSVETIIWSNISLVLILACFPFMPFSVVTRKIVLPCSLLTFLSSEADVCIVISYHFFLDEKIEAESSSWSHSESH